MSAAPPVRVLWLIKGLGPGGAERLLLSHAQRADRKRFDYAAAYVLPAKDHLVAELDALDVPCELLSAHGSWARRLRRRLIEDPVDIVHVQSPRLAVTARLLSRTLGRARPAVMYTEHNVWPRYHRLTRTANRLTFGLDDAHVAVSDEVKATVSARHRGSVDVVIHGIDLDEARSQRAHRAEVRCELGIADDDLVVGTVGNLRQQKRYDLLLRAARIVVDKDKRVRFVAIGQGQLEAQIAEWHRASALGDRFQFLGYRPDAVRVMSAFDVFTLASDYEGLPVALMEAMALGLPIVATAVGGVPAATREGLDATLVEPGRPDALASALLELATDGDRRLLLGQSAAERSEAFGAARAAADIEERYALLARSRHR